MTDDTSTRMFPDAAGAADLIPEEVLAQANEAKKNRWLSILIQLHNSARYTRFLTDNYQIVDRIDEEAKTIETLVVENPTSVGPALSVNQLWQMRKAIQFSGARAPDKLFLDIMKVLGQEPPSLITTATDVDIKRALADLDKGKLDA